MKLPTMNLTSTKNTILGLVQSELFGGASEWVKRHTDDGLVYLVQEYDQDQVDGIDWETQMTLQHWLDKALGGLLANWSLDRIEVTQPYAMAYAILSWKRDPSVKMVTDHNVGLVCFEDDMNAVTDICCLF